MRSSFLVEKRKVGANGLRLNQEFGKFVIMRKLLVFVLLVAMVIEFVGCRAICQAFESEGRDPQAERKMNGVWCASVPCFFLFWYGRHGERAAPAERKWVLPPAPAAVRSAGSESRGNCSEM